jgi:hypothetical protein
MAGITRFCDLNHTVSEKQGCDQSHCIQNPFMQPGFPFWTIFGFPVIRLTTATSSVDERRANGIIKISQTPRTSAA